MSQDDPRDASILHEPDDTLFSDKNICHFSVYFSSYALKQLEDPEYTPKPFVKYSDSNLLLFGYLENQYFFKQYEDQAEYLNEKKDRTNSIT